MFRLTMFNNGMLHMFKCYGIIWLGWFISSGSSSPENGCGLFPNHKFFFNMKLFGFNSLTYNNMKIGFPYCKIINIFLCF